jgi:CheY-like chemotaxis protein
MDMDVTPRAPLALVVDDEDSVRAFIEVILQMEGYDTVSASDGPAAIQLARQHRPDIITLDVMMPGMDGWEVGTVLDGDAFTARIPRVMVSGKPLAELEASPGRDRAAAVLAKPFDFAAFVEVVAEARRPVVPEQRRSTEVRQTTYF